MIFDFNEVKESGKLYGGHAGDKLGIVLDGEEWFLKFPKSTKSMSRVEISYTTAPLSEYIGSHIYEILGYDVHKTELGIYKDMLVVVCKDFETSGKRFFEYREIQNHYNKELRKALDESFSSSDSEIHGTNLETAMIHLKHNPVLLSVPDAEERFWQCIVIDGLINNNDRNSGNWGILQDLTTGRYTLAPIFDNGASFSNKLSDRQMKNILDDDERFASSSLNVTSGYNYQGRELLYRDLIDDFDVKELKDAIKAVVPVIEDKIDDITAFIQDIPNTHKGIEIMSDIRKEFYIKGVKKRFDNILYPSYMSMMGKS